MADTVENRFRKMEQYVTGLLQELEALQMELPAYSYEIRNIQMKTNEVNRNMHSLYRRVGPPNGGSPERGQGREARPSREVTEMAREIHRVLTQCKEYMEEMEQADPAFASCRNDLHHLFNQAQDRLQRYWEQGEEERREHEIRSSIVNRLKQDREKGETNQAGKEGYRLPSFVQMQKGFGET
ncbi:hypothetical protein C8P63_10630 [Melghirimyces profundicolus]|uniref:Uncharacterized protein n=1 Tax=Melghirimyces profundicolus TaxID=1242148 RepID=A0A2T6C0E0_9BACL|nr:hypothetical protein [Melghirimyces profundicolus]PTX61778.1 hypothetical protein C8P63_10630 [Melghirimyces profundicolus]